ncbi:MAG TPA: DnaB-like helicase C-terminal domain-containing protein [Gemmatimonadaceae bacterium]|nr:DnaB-like helicase C-terminal domain-containing protein [Gemmatimonadaceae bacterium]
MTTPRDIPFGSLMRRLDGADEGPAPVDTVPTGFPSVDKILGGGLRRGDLIILGGDVGSGKSSLALGIALRMAQQGRSVALFSGEMTPDRLFERALAIEGRVRVDDLRRGALDPDHLITVGMLAERLREHAPSFMRLPAGRIAELPDELRRTLDVEVAIIDSLQEVATAGAGRAEGEAAAARTLKAVALDLGIALLVTAHLPALSRQRLDLRPQLDDYGALGAVTQHADVVLGLFREEMYQDVPGVEGATELVVNKNRNGGTGYVDLYFYKQWLRFEDMLDPDR